MNTNLENLSTRLHKHLNKIYGDLDETRISTILEDIIKLVKNHSVISRHKQDKWTEKSIVMITYGDSVSNETSLPLKTLSAYLHKYFNETVTIVHILPFFPSSSDTGFSVIDYYKVDELSLIHI